MATKIKKGVGHIREVFSKVFGSRVGASERTQQTAGFKLDNNPSFKRFGVFNLIKKFVGQIFTGERSILSPFENLSTNNYNYFKLKRPDHTRVKRVLINGVVLSVLVVSLVTIFPVKAAETGYLYPDGDITAQFATPSSGTHYDDVDETTDPGPDGDFIETGTGGDKDSSEVEEYTMQSEAGTAPSVTAVKVWVYGHSAACNGGTCDDLSVDISLDGSYTGSPQTINLTTTTTQETLLTFNGTWTGDDDLQVKITRVVQGSGNPSNQDDNVKIDRVRAKVTYTPVEELDQAHFRWRDDSTALNTDGGWLAVEDSNAISNAVVDTTYRLRVEVDNISTSVDATNKQYQIEYAVKGAACSSATGWVGLNDSSTDAFEMVLTSHFADGDTIGTANFRLTGDETTKVAGQAKESADTTGNITLNANGGAGDYTELEYSFKPTSNSSQGESYCFRVTESGAAFTSYSNYPELTMRTLTAPFITQEAYIFENDDAATDASVAAGSEFTSDPTALNFIRAGERTNLRLHLKNTGDLDFTSTDELALFYDRNDNIWTKVTENQPYSDGAGDCDTVGGGSALFTCDTIDVTDSVGEGTALAFDPYGIPWIAFNDKTGRNLDVAYYVGHGGNCDTVGAGSDAWQCTTVDATGELALEVAMAIDDNGKVWVAYSDTTTVNNSALNVAEYVGSGGNCDTVGAGSDAWQCTTVDVTDDIGEHLSIALDNNNNPWISYHDNTNNNLEVAYYVGSNGNCDTVGAGSDAWQCTVVDATNSVGDHTSIAADPYGNMWVSYQDNTNQNLEVAYYVGSNGNCDSVGGGSDAWQCTTVDATDNTGQLGSIGFDPSGNAWVVYYYTNGTIEEIRSAKFVTSNGNCDTFGGGSDAWDCETIADRGLDTVDNYKTSIAFDPSGNAWVAFYDDTGTAENLVIVRYVGSGGNCDTLWSGSDSWECLTVDATDNVGKTPSLAFDPIGNPWISYHEETTDDLEIAYMNRSGEITLAKSDHLSHQGSLSESHADMTSVTDTTNRDDTGTARCVGGTGVNWNNGVYSAAENLTGLTLPYGDTTPQCTEVMWTLDTTNATENQTYRFIVASKDSFAPYKNRWRGPIQIDEYPTITVTNQTDTRYFKAANPVFSNCGGSTTWGCLNVDVSDDVGEYNSIAFDPEGVAWVSYVDLTNNNLEVAKYVGSGGDCGTLGAGSDAWDCSTIDAAIAQSSSLAIDELGVVHVAYRTTPAALKYATYVGDGSGTGCDDTSDWDCVTIRNSETYDIDMAIGPEGRPYITYHTNSSSVGYAYFIGGSGGSCTDTAWNCEVVDNANSSGYESSIAINNEGNPWITYVDNAGVDAVRVAYYVGTGGSGCNTAGPEFECTEIHDGVAADIAINPNGTAYVALYDLTKLVVAEYVGDATGTCTDTDWDCTTVDGSGGNFASIAFGPEGNPWVSYQDGSTLKIARYVTSGGNCDTAESGADAWQCETVANAGCCDSANSNSRTAMTLAFDKSGLPWISYAESSGADANLGVAKMHKGLFEPIVASAPNVPWGNNAYSTNLMTPLSAGRQGYGVANSACGKTTYAGYCGLRVVDGAFDTVAGSGLYDRPEYVMTTRFDANTTIPKVFWSGKTNLAPNTSGTSGDIVLEIYNHNTDTWDELTRDNSTSDCSSFCSIEYELATATPANYYQTTTNLMHIRVYQVLDGSTTVTFGIDQFNLIQTTSQMRVGNYFLNGERQPLNTR